MPFQRTSRKITLWGSRLSFPHLFKPEHVRVNGKIISDEPRFSVRVIVNPSLVADVQQLEEEIIRESWPEGIPPGIQIQRALQPGEIVAPNDPQMKGTMILSANAKQDSPPQLVSIHKGADGRFMPLTDQSMIYSGCEAHVHVGLYSTQIKVTEPMINVGLNAVQPTERPMDRFDGRTSAEDAFADAPREYAPAADAPGGPYNPGNAPQNQWRGPAPDYTPPAQPGAPAQQYDQWGMPIQPQ